MGPRVSMLCILQQSFVMGRIAYVDKARIHPQWPRKPCMLSWRDVRHGGGVLMDESRKEGKGVGMRNRHHVREDLPTASCLRYAGAHDKSVRYRYMYRRQVHVYLLLLCLVLRRASCTAD